MDTNYETRIQMTLDHIEEHLSGPLSVECLAEVACFSAFHFHRVFQTMVGDAVMEYVRKRRLARAAYQIAHTEQKLIDIALDNGFQSPENFTRGMSMREARSLNIMMSAVMPTCMSWFRWIFIFRLRRSRQAEKIIKCKL